MPRSLRRSFVHRDRSPRRFTAIFNAGHRWQGRALRGDGATSPSGSRYRGVLSGAFDKGATILPATLSMKLREVQAGSGHGKRMVLSRRPASTTSIPPDFTIHSSRWSRYTRRRSPEAYAAAMSPMRRNSDEFGEGVGHGGSLAQPRMPGCERTARGRSHAVMYRTIDHWRAQGRPPDDGSELTFVSD